MPYQGEVLAGVYRIVDEIGAGGAGIIYRAYHLNLQKYVVVKKIRSNFVGVLNERGEVDILKSLHHTCLPQVYDFLQIGDEIYTVMDFIEGHDLKYYIDQGCRFEEEVLLRWLLQLGEVLSYLHAHGILHLDIKPANIMVTSEGNICLIDFNISLSGSGDSLTGLSAFYASPEQQRKWEAILYGREDKEGPLDERTDIYSLGATFYHLMTGYMPAPHLEEMIPLRDFALPYSKELVRVAERMLSPVRRKRYRSAQQLYKALENMQKTKAEKRTLNTVFWGMSAGIFLMLLLCGVLLFRNMSYVSKEERAAIQAQELALTELCRNGEYEEAFRQGSAFLNEEAREMEKLPGVRQSFLERLLEAAMGMEDFASADACLQELLILENKAEYHQDAAVIAAWQGDYESAEEELMQAEELGGDSTALKKSRAELYAAGGSYEEALAAYEELNLSDTTSLRRMAALALKAADGNLSFAQKAAEYYEKLRAERHAGYEDQLNLATAYGLCGMNEKAEEVLMSMYAEYPESYQVCLRLGILKYNAEIRKPLASRDFSKARKYAEEAEKLWENTGTKQEQEQLQELLRLTQER